MGDGDPKQRITAHLGLQGAAEEFAEDADGGGHLSIHSRQAGGLQALHPSANPGQVPDHHEGQHKAHTDLHPLAHGLQHFGRQRLSGIFQLLPRRCTHYPTFHPQSQLPDPTRFSTGPWVPTAQLGDVHMLTLYPSGPRPSLPLLTSTAQTICPVTDCCGVDGGMEGELIYGRFQ
jgi:hypothetical protein